MSEEPVLLPEEVAGVLSGKPGEETTETPDSPDTGPQAYSLREPVAIPPSAEDEARQLLERVAAVLGEVFRSEAGEGIGLTLDGLQQQRTAAALSVLPPPSWVISLTGENGGGICLALPSTIGLAFVDMALGGPGTPPDEGREPTALESRVLARMIGSVADKIGVVLGRTLKSLPLEVGSVPTAVATAGETVGVGLLRFKIGEGDHASLLLASASWLLPSRKETAATHRAPGPLAPRLEKVSLVVRPVLPAGQIRMNQLMALEQGKVLELGARKDALLDLRASGRTIASGRIVRRDDQPVFAVENAAGRTERRKD